MSVVGGVKNFKTTKNIILNDSTTVTPHESELVSMPATTKTSVVIQTPIQTCSSTSLKRSQQFVTPLNTNNNNKYTVHFNENSNDRDSITSNDSNDTIIEADISSLSNLDSCNSSKRNSDFFDKQHQQQLLNSGLFYFNPENLNLHSSSLNNLTRRNSMPNSTIISNIKRNSLNVTDL
jgi:hypothetical protein